MFKQGSAERQRLGPVPIGLFLVWVLVLVFLFRPRVYGFDPVGYYSWLRSSIIQGSLDVSDEFAHYGVTERGLSSTGYRLNEWPVGSALLWAPFFLLGHGLALAGQVLGLPWTADGYSMPYLVATGLGSAVYALLALCWLYRLCCDLAPPRVALLAVLTGWLASPLVFYMAGHPFMAHANDFFLNTLFLLLWIRDERPTWRSRLILGLVGGLAACVRPQSATLLLWPGVEMCIQGIRACFRRQRSRQVSSRRRSTEPGLGSSIASFVALGAGALAGFSPQMVVWRVVFGNWLLLNAYGAVGAGSFDWCAPHFFDVLFSTNRGLFLWTPIALLALWGLVWHLIRMRRRWALFLLANLLAQVYVVGSWSSWSGACAFGQRFLVNTTPAWALGLTALYLTWRKGRGWLAALAVSVLLIGWNLLLLMRYALQDVPRFGPVSLDKLLLGQFTFLWNLAGHAAGVVQGLKRRIR